MAKSNKKLLEFLEDEATWTLKYSDIEFCDGREALGTSYNKMLNLIKTIAYETAINFTNGTILEDISCELRASIDELDLADYDYYCGKIKRDSNKAAAELTELIYSLALLFALKYKKAKDV